LKDRASSVVGNITGVLQASLFDSEIDAAENLLSNGHVRAAGAVAGVTLEAHLASVCSEVVLENRTGS